MKGVVTQLLSSLTDLLDYREVGSTFYQSTLPCTHLNPTRGGHLTKGGACSKAQGISLVHDLG